MKKYLIFAATAAFALVSCVKETPIEKQDVPDGLVRMTFQASIEADAPTRAYLATNGKSTEWKAGDEIAVFDNVNNNVHKFVAESDGATTSFTGTVNVGAESFVAVYPYTDATAYDDESDTPITANIPVIQEAVMGSYDPKAALFVATVNNDPPVDDVLEVNQKFTFTPAFGLFKVTVDVDDVMALYVENTNIAMSGSVYAKATGSLSNGPGTTYKWISLQKEDGTALDQGDYYIVSRFAGTNSFKNFKMTYVKSDASALTRAASDDITSTTFKRKSIADMGELSDFPGTPAVSWYTYYQAGLDVKIGSKTINRLTEGDATLIQNESASDVFDFRSAVSGKTGVFFFATAGGAFKNGSTISISKNLYLLNDANTKVLFTSTDNKSWNFMNGSLYLKGLTFDVSGRTGGALFTNYTGVSAVSDDFIMEDCAFYGMTKNLYAPSSTLLDYIVRRIEVIGCSFGYNMTSNIDMLNLSAATHPADLKYFVFKNNLVYNSTGTNTTRVTILSMPAYAEAAYTLDAQITENLMVNAVGASNGSWAFTDVVSLEITDNVFYDGNSYGSNCNLFDIKNTSTSVSDLVFSGNICIGLSSDKKWTHTNGTIAGLNNVKNALPNSTNQITKSEASSVFSAAPSITAGKVSYTLLPAYQNVGPQNLPADI